MAQHQSGEPDAARETLAAACEAANRIADKPLQAAIRADIAVRQAQTGAADAAVRTAETVLEVADHHFGRIAAALLDADDRASLKRLLLTAAHRPHAADQLRRLLPRIYPEQGTQISAALQADVRE